MENYLIVTLNSITSSIRGRLLPANEIIKDCSFKPKGYQFSPKFGKGRWDGSIKLAKSRRVAGSVVIFFPTGLFERVCSVVEKKGLRVKIINNIPGQKLMDRPILSVITKTYRYYQKDGLLTAIQKQRGIIKQPTGSGKTLVGAGLIKSIGKPAIFLTDRKTILYQTIKVMEEELGKRNIGVIGLGRDDRKIITLGLIKTISIHLNKYKKHLQSKVVLIGDEVHRGTSRTWIDVMNEIPAPIRIGLSATPIGVTNSLNLEAVFGPIIYDIDPDALMKKSYLSRPEIYLAQYREHTLPERYDYHTAYLKGIVQNKFRNTLIIKFALAIKKHNKDLFPLVVLAKSLEHLALLSKLFSKTSLRVRKVEGLTSVTERDRLFTETNERKIDVLLGSSIMDEGVDIPEIRSMISASGGKSAVKTIQRLGRSLRITSTKKKVLFVDFYDSDHPYLLTHSKKRRRSYRKEKYKCTEIKIGKLIPIIKNFNVG